MQVVPLFSAAQVEARIAEIAKRLYRDYADAPISVLRIAEGATRFVEALSAALVELGVELEHHSVSARRSEGGRHGAVQVEAFDPGALDGRDVLVVDGVVAEGGTLRAVLEIVAMAETRSVRTAVLVDKREGRRGSFEPDYAGFLVDRGWVVGFGMDVNGELHELDEIGVVLGD